MIFRLVVALIIWGWVDDLAVSIASADPTDETRANDEYLSSAKLLPSQKRPRDCAIRSTLSARCVFDRPVLQASHEGLPEGKPLPLSGTDPLYAFMSLQC
jgi:hypothetical protein